MPNWTTNKMIIHDDDLHLITNRRGDVDFNVLRPMHKSLDIGNVSLDANRFAMAVSRGEATSMTQAPYDFLRRRLVYRDGVAGRDYDITNPSLSDYKRFGDLLCLNVGRYGHADWYSWCSSEEGWGTKWNACQTTHQDWDGEAYCLVEFLTAWSCPSASLVAELRAKCTHPLRFECVDEDGYGDVHDENGTEIPLEGSLFRAFYYDEDDNELAEEEYEEAKRAGKYVWRVLE